MPEARGAPRVRPRPTDGALVLLRHGESTTNAADRFTGRLDSPLTVVGIAQAHGAAALVAHNVARVDAIVSSPMLRARQTASVIAQDLGVADRAIEIATALAERDLGALTGMSKSRAVAILGPDRYWQVRRALDARPPVTPSDAASPGHWFEDASGLLPPARAGESLGDVVGRLSTWWAETEPRLRAGQTLLVIGHGDSLRALCAVTMAMESDEIEDLSLPPAQPLLFRMDKNGLRPRPRGGRPLGLWNGRTAGDRIARGLVP